MFSQNPALHYKVRNCALGAMCCLKEVQMIVFLIRVVFVIRMEFTVKHACKFKYTAGVIKIAVFCYVSIVLFGRWYQGFVGTCCLDFKDVNYTASYCRRP
jgi:hypothetical protein